MRNLSPKHNNYITLIKSEKNAKLKVLRTTNSKLNEVEYPLQKRIID